MYVLRHFNAPVHDSYEQCYYYLENYYSGNNEDVT